MAKLNQSNDLNGRRGSSALLAIGLAASLAAFGCTTNVNPGSGAPLRVTPDIRTAPTSNVPIGSERTPVPPPMTSSYMRQEVMPNVTAASRSLHHTPEEAAAIMAGSVSLRGRYLGVANPGPAPRTVAMNGNVAKVQVPPYSVAEQTINSSLVSPPTTVVNSGAGVTESTSAAVIGALSGTPATTAAATLPAIPAVTASTPTPTATVSNNATITAASIGATTGGSTAATTVAPTGITPATATTATAAVTATPTVTSASSDVRIVRNAGATTVTNVATPASSSRNQ